MVDRPVFVVVVAAAVGLVVGPVLAGIAGRSVAVGPVPGWWRGGDSPVSTVIAVTALSGALFAGLALRYGESATLLAWCWLAATGIVLALVDVRQRRLPHRLTGSMAAGGLGLLAVAAAVEDQWPQMVSACLAGVVVFAAEAVVQLVFPRHTGGGDTALYGALAVFLGWFGWSGLLRGLLFAAGLTAAVAIGVWAMRGRSATFPAGPSLIAGTIIAVLSAW